MWPRILIKVIFNRAKILPTIVLTAVHTELIHFHLRRDVIAHLSLSGINFPHEKRNYPIKWLWSRNKSNFNGRQGYCGLQWRMSTWGHFWICESLLRFLTFYLSTPKGLRFLYSSFPHVGNTISQINLIFCFTSNMDSHSMEIFYRSQRKLKEQSFKSCSILLFLVRSVFLRPCIWTGIPKWTATRIRWNNEEKRSQWSIWHEVN